MVLQSYNSFTALRLFRPNYILWYIKVYSWVKICLVKQSVLNRKYGDFFIVSRFIHPFLLYVARKPITSISKV